MMDFTSALAGPETAPEAAPAKQEPSYNLSTEQLAELPPVRAVMQGKPSAIYADENATSPLAISIGRNFQKIGELGLALYRSPSKRVVLFNPSVLDSKDLLAADKAGKLDSIAAPLESFDAAPAPQAAASVTEPPAPVPFTKGLTPRAQSKLAGTRISALIDDEPPSKRPIPGGGRILNSLLERAV